MKIFVLALLIIVSAVLVTIENGNTQGIGTAPTLSVNVVLSSPKYLFAVVTDPIMAEITITHTGSQPIVANAGFTKSPFHLLLTFVGPDGKPVVAEEAGDTHSENGPPRVVLINNNLAQVDEVEILPVGFKRIIQIPDLRQYYAFTKPGRYTGRAVFPIRTFPTFFTVADTNYSLLGSFTFAGAIESEKRTFSLIADIDGDGYAYPEPDSRIIPANTVADCDDNDANVNPGKQEIPGDGKDNDCNPATLDDVIAVPIDILPGTFPNVIKLSSKGATPVAIFSTTTFDATKVDPLTVTLEDAQVVALKGKGTPQSSFADVNKDGRLDLIVHVETQALTLTATDTEAVLRGRTFALPGRPVFDIRGVDKVTIVP